MDDFGDDFGYLYTSVGNQSRFNRDDSSDDERYLSKNDDNLGENAGVGDVIGDDSDEDEEEEDDFVVVVNNDDFDAKSSGVEGIRASDEVNEDVKVDDAVIEANLRGNGGNVARLSGGNSQYTYVRQNGAASTSSLKGTTSRVVDSNDIGRFQPKRSSHGQYDAAGSSVPNTGDQGNGFWLPRYRTIFDVDIDTMEHKPWTLPGACMTDYFNFGFDEDSWKGYCQSLDQLRHQSSTKTRNQGCGISRSNLAGATKERATEEYTERALVANGQQIGQAILIEESNTERRPSMEVKLPRLYDSDVVIEINLEEPEEPPNLPKEPDDKLEAEFEMSEKVCEQRQLVPETQTSGDSKAYELRKIYAEENFDGSTPSSDLRRSYQSATVSNSVLEKSCNQTEGPNSGSVTQNSGRVDTSSGGNQREINILKDDGNSDRDSTETNPCVAGIDLLSDDHIQSTTTSSYSHSEGLNDDDPCDLRKSQNSQRSSPDSVVDRKQVSRVDYKAKMDDAERKENSHKYLSRAESSIEERHKHSERYLSRNSEVKSHNRVNRDNNDCHIGIRKHTHASRRPRLHHRDEEWRKASDFIDEDLPSYREKDYFLECYDKRSMKDQIYAEGKRNSPRQNYWRSRDDINSSARRSCDEDAYYSERTRGMKGAMGCRESYLEERETVLSERKHLFQSPPHSMPRPGKCRVYHDEYLNKRGKHFPPVKHRHSDCPMADRYADSPLDRWQREYVEPETLHQRRSKHFRREAGTLDKGDEFIEYPTSDIKYSRFNRDHEYHSEHALPSIHDDEPVFAESYHYSSPRRGDDAGSYCKYERNIGPIFLEKRRDVREPYDNRNAYECYDREDTQTYLDQYDYFENRSQVFQSEDVDWREDARIESNFNNGVCYEMLDSVSGMPQHKRHGAERQIVSNEMFIDSRSIKDTHDSISVGDKFYDRTSRMQSRAKHERPGLWRRKPVDLHNYREKKSSGFNGARLQSGRFQKHPKEQQLLDASFPEKAMVNKSLKLEKSQDKPLITTRGDLEVGQIPTEIPRSDVLKSKMFDSEGLVQKGSQKSVNKNDNSVYDESRILATLAKMEKRRARFKEPILVKKDSDSYSNPQVVKPIETVESTAQRPTRKRQWGGR